MPTKPGRKSKVNVARSEAYLRECHACLRAATDPDSSCADPKTRQALKSAFGAFDRALQDAIAEVVTAYMYLHLGLI